MDGFDSHRRLPQRLEALCLAPLPMLRAACTMTRLPVGQRRRGACTASLSQDEKTENQSCLLRAVKVRGGLALRTTKQQDEAERESSTQNAHDGPT